MFENAHTRAYTIPRHRIPAEPARATNTHESAHKTLIFNGAVLARAIARVRHALYATGTPFFSVRTTHEKKPKPKPSISISGWCVHVGLTRTGLSETLDYVIDDAAKHRERASVRANRHEIKNRRGCLTAYVRSRNTRTHKVAEENTQPNTVG